MPAIEVIATGGPEVLKYVDKSRPSPDRGEVLIKAEAVGANFVDTWHRYLDWVLSNTMTCGFSESANLMVDWTETPRDFCSAQ